jgi:hypothetical protein
MFKRLPPQSSAGLKSLIYSILVAMSFFVCAVQEAEAASPEIGLDQSDTKSAKLSLAAKIEFTGRRGVSDNVSKLELISQYENVYGAIGLIPEGWPALVRRALVCQQAEDRTCVQTSMKALDKMGGIKSLKLSDLFEVTRFGMPVATVRSRLMDAEQETGSYTGTTDSFIKPPSAALVKEALPPSKPVISSVDTAPVAVVAPAPHPAAKEVVERAVTPREPVRPSRVGVLERSGILLVGVLVAVSLLLGYFLISTNRARKVERIERLRALQEIQRLGDLRSEEKLQADHALWTEQLKAEVALEAQKAYSEDVLRVTRHAAEEAIKSDRLRAAEAFKAERLRAEEAIKAEQLKTEEAAQAAKSHADQAIDAYDQMAAKELVHAHKQNDELQQALNAEKVRRETQEQKIEEAMQAVETGKLREAQLQEAVRVEQIGRASDARLAAEKLKAAQQAAAALQASLVATRALAANSGLQVNDAIRSEHLNIAKENQILATVDEPEAPVGQTSKPEVDASAGESVAMNDARG